MPVPPDDLLAAIRRLGDAGVKFVVVTGQPMQFGLAGAELLGSPELCLGVAPEYGGWLLMNSKGRNEIQLRDLRVAEQETDAFRRQYSAVLTLVLQTGGQPDDAAVSFVSAYWPDANSFEVARARASEFEAIIGDDKAHLRFRWSDGDWSMACIQRSVSKAGIVKYLLAQGHEIVLAAGDAESDIPTIAAARLGVICTEHDDHSTELKAHFADRIAAGTVLLAPGLHGHGLAVLLNQVLDEDLLK